MCTFGNGKRPLGSARKLYETYLLNTLMGLQSKSLALEQKRLAFEKGFVPEEGECEKCSTSIKRPYNITSCVNRIRANE